MLFCLASPLHWSASASQSDFISPPQHQRKSCHFLLKTRRFRSEAAPDHESAFSACMFLRICWHRASLEDIWVWGPHSALIYSIFCWLLRAVRPKLKGKAFMFHDIFIFFLQHNSRLLTAWFSEELGKSSLASEPGTVESSPSAALPGRNSTSRCHQSSASSDSPSSSRRETKASTAFCDRPPDRKRSTRGASWRRIATAFSTSFG